MCSHEDRGGRPGPWGLLSGTSCSSTELRPGRWVIREGASRVQAALDASFTGGCWKEPGSSDNPASGHTSAPPLPGSCGMWIRPSAWFTKDFRPWLISVFPSFQCPQYPEGCSLSLCSALTAPPGHTLRLDRSASPLPGSPGTVFLSQLSQWEFPLHRLSESLPWITWFSLLPAFIAPSLRPLSPASSLKLYSWTDRGRKYYLWASGRTLKEFTW